MASSNGFVRKWYEFNLNLNNIMTAITARKYNLDIQKVIVGTGDVANALRTSGARDWGLSQELDYFEDVARLTEEDDLSQREHSVSARLTRYAGAGLRRIPYLIISVLRNCSHTWSALEWWSVGAVWTVRRARNCSVN